MKAPGRCTQHRIESVHIARPAAQRVTHSHTHSLRITANAVESRERRVVHTHSTGDWVHRVVSECAVYSLSPVSTLSSRALSGCGDYALWPMAMGGELSRGRGALGESGVGLAAPGRTLALVSASRATAITASKVSAYSRFSSHRNRPAGGNQSISKCAREIGPTVSPFLNVHGKFRDVSIKVT